MLGFIKRVEPRHSLLAYRKTLDHISLRSGEV